MLNTNRSQPQNWLMPFRNLNSATLGVGESLAMVLYFQVKKKVGNEIAHTMFAVVRKGDKAISRNIVSHGDDVGFCTGHATDIAEYPIANINELIEETRNHGMMMGVMLMQDASLPITVDQTKPMLCMELSEGLTKAEISKKFEETSDEYMSIAGQVVVETLALNDQPIAASPAVAIPAKQNGMTNLERIEKAAKEQDLIKKFGKKPMEELAKKMKYNGEIINKSKSKTHVN